MKSIAVVEDNPDNRLLLHAMLEHDYEVTGYAEGRAALCGMRESRPDLVLVDISLPGMDGLEVLKAMRDDEALRDVPAIAVTAHAASEDQTRFLNAGFDAYVAKPIRDDAVLVELIESCLR